ncbi:hypothetical protein [Lacipirellula sp.]|uniref:hypothetical protein n=1 Tax=Lacipirellula sp. TaxID=2691419 RepID=UPI003D0F72B5
MSVEIINRWLPRYSLRVLLAAMTLLSLLMWRQMNWLQQRRDCLARGAIMAEPDPAVRAPGILSLFGEHGYSEIWGVGPAYEGGDAVYEQEIESLFPEADKVYVEIYCPPESDEDG